jgi:AI-2 transport protein TqsA
MTEPSNALGGTRFLVAAAAFVIIIYGINLAQSIVALFLFSVFLALIGTPPVLWLERKRVPSSLAVMIIMACMIVFLLIIGGVARSSLSTFSDAWPVYQKRLQEQVLALKPFLADNHIIVTDKVLLEYVNPGPVMGLVAGLFPGIVSVFSNIVLILLTVTFILLEASSFPIKLRAALGKPQQAFPRFTKFVNDIKRFMVIKTAINLIAAVLIGLWLFILGVDFPILWGFVAFLLHYVPNLGSIICAIPAVLLAFIQLGTGSAALAAAGYLVVSFTIGNVVEPRLMGRKLGLSTLVVFLSLVFWGRLLGLIGVVLCIPLTMTLKFVFESSQSTQWIAIMLGSEKSAECIQPVSNKGK